MSPIIPLRRDPHDEVQQLLPWYVTARLDAEDAARVEAHLATCAQCQSDLRSERKLQAEVSAMPMTLEHDWARLRQRIAAQASPPADPEPATLAQPARRRAAWVGWAIAAQLLLVVLGGAELVSYLRPVEYQTLAAPPASQARFILTFRPETPERDLRAALNAAGVRLVDGPTSANAYVVQAPGEPRATLAKLRAHPAVLAAEALHANEPR